MDDISQGSNATGSVGAELPCERHAQLCQMIATLERDLAILENLELTLATALLDHVIAEVKRQFTNER